MASVQTLDQPPLAVWGQSLNKSYGSRKSKLQVLNDLNLTVPKGAIYGLLGPSGCGKTTLLKCIVGRLYIDKGHLLVLGDKPGNSGHSIPGSMVGYMPQEMALFDQMTIGELLSYFGRIHSMAGWHVQERTDFLIAFLTLPPQGRLIGNLSGGQKRRVSFAVALLHEPELLILDEPTVGVDPILRERIWEHMIKIARQEGTETTVIITTHYIEEARQADVVGLMRNGRLLAEEKPGVLLERFNINTLEAVFLKLCHDDQVLEEQSGGSNGGLISQGRMLDNGTSDEKTPLLKENHRLLYTGIEHQDTSCHCPSICPSGRNIFAQVIKNLTLMKRNIGFLLFEFILPAIQILLFCVCIGKDPYNLKVAIVNHDQGSMGLHFGQLFLKSLDTKAIDQVMYQNLDQAVQSVENQDTWGVIGIGKNFTEDLILRFTESSKVENSTIDGSSVHLYLDMTNQQISILLEAKIQLAFQDFSRKMLISVHMNERLADSPIKLEKAIYGKSNPSFTNFMAPGIILSIIFFMATGLTTLSFVVEKKEGLLERSLVAGMTPFDMILAHICTQLFVMMVQVAILLAIVLGAFSVPSEGPLIWVILLTLLQGFCGMTLGVLISALCEQETSAVQCALGSVYPMLLMSGIIWPIQAMPEWMRYISVCMPMTYAAEAMRNVLSRGLGIVVTEVWRGYLVTMGWSLGLLLLTGLILRLKK